jgi:hypothetical protein
LRKAETATIFFIKSVLGADKPEPVTGETKTIKLIIKNPTDNNLKPVGYTFLFL